MFGFVLRTYFNPVSEVLLVVPICFMLEMNTYSTQNDVLPKISAS